MFHDQILYRIKYKKLTIYYLGFYFFIFYFNNYKDYALIHRKNNEKQQLK